MNRQHSIPTDARSVWALIVLAVVSLFVLQTVIAHARPIDDGAWTPSPVRSIDLNTDEASLLCALPRIGPTLADRIIADRIAHGPFTSIDDLQRVHGIGPRTVERIEASGMIQPIQTRP